MFRIFKILTIFVTRNKPNNKLFAEGVETSSNSIKSGSFKVTSVYNGRRLSLRSFEASYHNKFILVNLIVR